MKKLLLATAIVAILASPANASMLSDSEGVGLVKCAAFNTAIRRADAATVKTTFFSWAQGFMTAVNLAIESNGGVRKNLGGASYEEKVQAMSSYCASNPNNTYFDGVVDLIKRLQPMGEGQ
jgi:hypothetical protein